MWLYRFIQRFSQYFDFMIFPFLLQVGLIILYDHVHPVGAFAKTSNIDVSVHFNATEQ